MFIDASAAIAILGGEDDAAFLAQCLERADVRLVSPLSIYETVTGLSRKRACPVEEAQAIVDLFVQEIEAHLVEIDEPTGRLAVKAFSRFGKGRHPADLNLGDCFSYACTQLHGVPLLFKGNDFIHTDVVVAWDQQNP
jgi:ribonuclease VapC